MKMLIVDDEKAIREHIAGFVEWKELGCEVIGQAANGLEAFELMQRVMPDVLITDIRMPVMDGIELAEWASRRNPETSIIFLTAYSEFDYAKQAVKLGAADFITKPFHPAELVESVRCLMKQSPSAAGKELNERESILQTMLDPTLPTEEKEAALQAKDLSNRRIVVLAVEVDNADMLYQMGRPLSKLSLREKIEQVTSAFPYSCWSSLSQSGVYVVLFQRSPREPMDIGEVFRMARFILASCGNAFSFSVSVAISAELDSLLELERGMREVKQCFDYRMLLGGKSIVSIQAVRAMQDDQQTRKLSSLSELEDMLRRGESDRVRDFMRQAYRQIMSLGLSKKDVHTFALEIAEKAEQVMKESGAGLTAEDPVVLRKTILSFDILADLIKYVERMLLRMLEAVGDAKRHAEGSAIAKALQYIDERYAEDISLYSLAEHLYLNYSYLSRLIKKETGKNFRELLWEKRIEVAKRKLKTTSMKSYEVAYAVGFKDPAHFSQLFKRMVGVSPHDYK
ncbi:response regulator transcription factor [Paenibacillus sp.]|uniref:response regulator transcription factor n=1 Tax=Paenibacillus sp. TaxID=58172 RepID=UPI002D55C7B4|nr:response regulator [Paenibacillus sp.]HZG56189.1 response regulator [Paenibacillus sp.]